MKIINFDNAIAFIKKNNPILLVGADEMARKFHKSVTEQFGKDAISLWTGKNHAFYQKCGLDVCNPENVVYDSLKAIFVSSDAVSFYNSNLKLKKKDDMPVFELKEVPLELLSDYEWKDICYTDEQINERDLLYLDPVELVTPDRLDIVIRYIACNELISGQQNDGITMYKKLSESINDCKEYVRPFTKCSFFSDYSSKKGIEEFLDSFIRLIESMKKNGFSKEHYVPLSESGGVINGAHRIATALALGEKVYAYKFVGFGEPAEKFEKEGLKQRGFNELQIEKIIKTYNSLKNIKQG